MNTDHFVQGVLTEDDGAFILEPFIRLANGEGIHILYSTLRPRDERGEDDPLSLLLEVNKWYELLLIAQIGLGGGKRVSYVPTLPPDTRLELKSRTIQISTGAKRSNYVGDGIVLNVDWDASSVKYLAVAGPAIYTRRFVLVQTAIGKMVLNYQDLKTALGDQIGELAPGGYLEWEPARHDLLAIIAKRDPEPGE